MLIVWGSAYYGKVDELPGIGYTATRFGHLWYIPVIPLGSMFAIRKVGDGYEGFSLGLSVKSVLIAWTRAALILAGIISTVSILASESSLIPALIAITCWTLLILSKSRYVPDLS